MAANSAGICTSFKSEILTAVHNLNSHTFKIAVFTPNSSITPATTAYAATGEVSSSGYSAGGAAVTDGTVTTSGTTAYWTPTGGSVSWSGVTFTTDCALLYNTSASNKAVASFTYTSNSPGAGTFSLTFPTNDASNALIRIS